jgi:single-stranded DNA-specific DHH superfamily exonuclease
MAFLLAAAADRHNWDMFDMALVGAMADRQHLGGLKGLNARLALIAEDKGSIRSLKRLKLMELPVREALAQNFEPLFLRFFTGEEDPGDYLEALGVPAETPVSRLGEEERSRLGSALALELLRQGVRPELASDVLMTGYTSRRYEGSIEQISHLVNSAGRRGEMALGMAACLGSRDALLRAGALREQHRKGIREGLERVIAGEYREGENIRHFESDSDERAGALAGLAMMFILGPEKPTLSYARVGDEYKISGRGTDYLVKRRGVDLAAALKTAAELLGGRGGGHPPAAGASVPVDRLGELLTAVDGLVGAQLKGGGEEQLKGSGEGAR